jgi:ABC-type transport system involved in cytochrome c biogenesis permease subunit
MMRDPKAWADKPLIYVPWLALRAQLGLPAGEQRATLHQVEAYRPQLQGVVAKKQRVDQSGKIEPWTADEEAAYTLANRYAEALSVIGGRTILLTPLAVDAAERTWVLDQLAPTVTEDDRPWRAALREVVAKPEGRAERLAEKDIWLSFEDLVRSPDPLLAAAPPGLAAVLKEPLVPAVLQARGAHPAPGLLRAELIYAQAHPFTIAWVGFILGGILIASGLGTRRWSYRIGLILTWIAIAATVGGLAVRTVITGLGAVTNLFETLIYVGLIVAVLGLYFTRLSGKSIYAVAGGIGAGLCAMVGEAMPPDLGSHIGQLQPVLRSKFWLWIHVKVVVGAYAPLVLALVLGNLVLWKAWRERRKVTAEESRNLYRCLQWGTVLMAAGTLLGAVWADQAWGRFWGWDPKEVGALLIVLTYLIPLHLRYVGVVGPTGLAGWSVLGFLSVIWSWYGVNFILGTGLHAYGFGSGGQVLVLPLTAAQVALTAWQLRAIARSRRPATA